MNNVEPYKDINKYHENIEKHPGYLEMQKRILELIKKESEKKESLEILEIGSGTGILTKHLVELGKITAVEEDKQACEFLEQIKSPSLEIINKDIFEYNDGKQFDLVVSSFAHDHLALYEKRIKISEKISSLLKVDSPYIVGHELLPEFDLKDKKSYENALQTYHEYVIQTALEEGNKETAELEKEALNSGLEGIHEFKMHRKMFLETMESVGFEKEFEERIFPKEKQDVGGVYVHLFRKINHNNLH